MATSLQSSLSQNQIVVATPYEGTTSDDMIAVGSSEFIQHEAYSQRVVQRTVRLSAGIMSMMAGAIDFLLVLGAAAVLFPVYFELVNPSGSATPPERYILPAILAATLFVGGFERLGGYQLMQLPRLHWQLTRATTTWGAAVSILLLMAFFGKVSDIYSRGWAVLWIIIVPALLLTERGILHRAVAGWIKRGYLAHNVVVVGAGSEGQRLIAKLHEARDNGIVVRGVFDDRRSRTPGSVSGLEVLGTTDDLLHFGRRTPIDEVIIALPLGAEQRLKVICDKLKVLATDVRLSIEPLAATFQVRTAGNIGNVLVLDVADRPLKHWRAVAKWVEDKMLAVIILMLVSPLMAIITLFIKLDSRGPVLFVQPRFGFNNEVINVLKFRTMYVDRGDPSGGHRTVRNDPRVTRVGRVLRSLSFDELPQLVNVLRGDMSLVGPRPHAITMKAGDHLYCDAVDQYLHRHRVKPGITGWAQVNGLRGEVDTIEKARARIAHDLTYIDHWSPWLDLTILLRTVGLLRFREDTY
jgi:Undecaprenyl-phosphate glucose phosphotransferase